MKWFRDLDPFGFNCSFDDIRLRQFKIYIYIYVIVIIYYIVVYPKPYHKLFLLLVCNNLNISNIFLPKECQYYEKHDSIILFALIAQ